jgi:hypothetical protein
MREVLPNTTKPYINVQHLVTNIGLTYFRLIVTYSWVAWSARQLESSSKFALPQGAEN